MKNLILTTTDGKHFMSVAQRNGNVVLFRISPESIPVIKAQKKSWCVLKHGDKTYAFHKDGHNKNVYLHRVIAGLTPTDQHQADHISGDTLDCRLSNLRAVSKAENQSHRLVKGRPGKKNTTGVANVSRHGRGFVVNVAGQYVGYFPTLRRASREAAQARARVNASRIAAAKASMNQAVAA